MHHHIYHGDDIIMIHPLDMTTVHRLAAAASGQNIGRNISGNIWQNIVPGLDSLTLQYDPVTLLDKIRDDHLNALTALIDTDDNQAAPTIAASADPVILPICYDAEFGPDQAVIAAALGIDIADLPDWHQRQNWQVAMLGFLPGFGYLQSEAAFPQIPRLADPRAHVAAGSVGILGAQCGLYALSGPGGWPLIGRVASRLFDPGRDPPALLAAGHAIQFSAISRAQYNHLMEPG